MKKKILFILNTYDFMSKNLSKNFSLQENYNIFNKMDKSWANTFFNKLKKEYFLDKYYPVIHKKLLGEKLYLEKLENKIESFKPDLIFVLVNTDEIHNTLKKYNKIKKIIWISHKIEKKKLLNLKKLYDYFITGNDFLLTEAKKIKFNSFKMLISSPKFLNLKYKNFKKRSNSLYFAGSLGKNFSKRLSYLIFLSENFHLKLRLRNLIEKLNILNILNYMFLKMFPNITNFFYEKKILPLTNKLKYINEDEIFGDKLLEELKDYKFCININSDFDQNNTINSRVFEALSCGCLLFTDENKVMKKIFKEKKHVVYFKSQEDLKEKIKYYKKNIKISYEIAKKGNMLFNKEHHTEIRLKEFKKILRNMKI